MGQVSTLARTSVLGNRGRPLAETVVCGLGNDSFAGSWGLRPESTRIIETENL